VRWLALAILGLGGVAILVSLGLWQLRRLEWKTALLADIEARIAAAPAELPADPDPEADRYLPVEVTGRTTGREIHVLVSTAQTGAGYRVVAPLETGGRRILVDLGILPTEAKDAPRPGRQVTVAGNLHWPVEVDRFTPGPDREDNIWFARDVPAMAEALGTEPLLVVARTVETPFPGIVTRPVSTAGIPNGHLNYAVTWFSIAVLWAGMTLLLGWRMAGPVERRV
jgi:surfeit locus 1 family protein